MWTNQKKEEMNVQLHQAKRMCVKLVSDDAVIHVITYFQQLTEVTKYTAPEMDKKTMLKIPFHTYIMTVLCKITNQHNMLPKSLSPKQDTLSLFWCWKVYNSGQNYQNKN